MARAGREAEQISALGDDLEHSLLSARVNVEGSAPLDEEADLVVRVRVLGQEFRPERVAVGVVGVHPDDVCGLVPAPGHETIDVASIGSEDLHLTGARREIHRRAPALEVHADPAELARDLGRLGERPFTLPGSSDVVGPVDGQDRHRAKSSSCIWTVRRKSIASA